MPKLVAIFLLLIFAILTTAPQSYAQKPTVPVFSRENERRSFASNVLRAINNAELDYKTKHGSYATWETLVGNGYFGDTGTKFISEEFPTVAHALYGLGPEIVPGWKLRLNLSSSGKSYDALLEDVTDPKCGYAGLTDERGLVRHSKSVACAL
jgi:type II secretory pathway pseudopilin PulG